MADVGTSAGPRLSAWGRAALVLLGVHVVLLFLPRIPPDVKGSLWNYLAGYGAALAGLVELSRQGPRLRSTWARVGRARRWAIGAGLVLVVLAATSALRAAAPDLFLRFSGEEGLWEPLTVFLYLGCATWLFGAARATPGADRRHGQLVGGAYALLGLEEIDYFGIFGGLIGRVQGIYVGSLHDVVHLAGAGALGPLAWGGIVAVVAAVALALWRGGYLRPRALLSMTLSADALWAALGLGFLAYAAVVEVPVFGRRGGGATLEEALELAGAVCLVLFALLRSGTLSRSTPAPSSSAPQRPPPRG